MDKEHIIKLVQLQNVCNLNFYTLKSESERKGFENGSKTVSDFLEVVGEISLDMFSIFYFTYWLGINRKL